MDDPGHKGSWEGIFWHPRRCIRQPHSMCKTVSKILTVAIYSEKTTGHSLNISLNDSQKWYSVLFEPNHLLRILVLHHFLLLSTRLFPSSTPSPVPIFSPFFSSPPLASRPPKQRLSFQSRSSFEQPALTGVDQDTLSSNLLLSTKVA